MNKKHLQDIYNHINPKDLLGIKKDNISLVPPEGIRGIAKAMEFGAKKYGAYNWRDKKVQYRIYLDAIMRHTLALVEGQDLDIDSGLSHLDHIGANVVILKDAMKYNCLVDNRDKPKNNHIILEELLISGYKKPIQVSQPNCTLECEIYNDFNKKFSKPHSNMDFLTLSGNEQYNTDYGLDDYNNNVHNAYDPNKWRSYKDSGGSNEEI